MKTYQLMIGEIVNGLRLDGVLRYDDQQLPIYSARCLHCLTCVPISHRLARLGAARCVSSAHVTDERRTVNHAEPRVVLTPEAAAEVALFNRPHEAERLKRAEQEAAESHQAERDYLRYARTAVLEWGYDARQLMTRESWERIGESGRARILARIEGEEE